MESTFKSVDSFQLKKQIDVCCREFENAWKNGGSPKMEEYVARMPKSGRGDIIRELLVLELNYRRSPQGTRLSDLQICALHPELMPEIAEQAEIMRQQTGASDGAATQLMTPKSSEFQPTIDHRSRSKGSQGSRGLHIRCPHCSNPVELLTDTPFESITCQTCGSAFSLVDDQEQTREAPVLKKIGRFELVSRLGMGGFGTVWKARDTELDRTVAVKIPRKGQLAREEVEQFFREARSAAQLRHPNIVPVHEVGRDGDTIFIVSDLIRGVSLSDWLGGSTPNSHETARLLSLVSDALHHAHQNGVIHRDLKPSNILLDDAGNPHIMDFGLAKREIGEVTMTIEGNILGTPAYMSPEQAAGEAHWTDRRSDIYSLGVILFKMLTGELPFRGNAQMQIHQRLNEDPPDPRTLNRHLPRDMCTICLKCLERDPNRRFNNAKELQDEFLRYQRREPIASRPISRVERVFRWAKRKPALASAIALTVLLAIAGPIAALVFHKQQARLNIRTIESDKLIKELEQGKQRTGEHIKDLRSQLDVWEGRANPWSFWPPKHDESPRHLLVNDVLEHSTASLAKPLGDGKYDRDDAARGYLGLAVLSDAIGKSDEARKYYKLARGKIFELRSSKPESKEYARALAQCDMRLAQLNHDTDADAAADELNNSRTTYRQLAKRYQDDPTAQIDWLEAEMRSSLRAKPEARAEHLDRVKEINEALEGKWPTKPAELYRLACYLTESEPVLAASAPQAAPAAAAETPKE